MKKTFTYLTIASLLISAGTKAQNVGIGTSTPDASAQLDISSTNKGVLVPRLSNPGSISNPAKGLLVFNTTTNSFFFYDGTIWKDINDVPATNNFYLQPFEPIISGLAGDSIGTSVSIGTNSGYCVVGAPGKAEGAFADAGNVFWGYNISGSNSYGMNKINVSLAQPVAAGDRFGAAVAIDRTFGGQDVVAGAPNKNTAGVNSGAAYYTYLGGSSSFVPFPAPTPALAAGDLFGFSVDVSGYSFATNKTLAVIGAPGDDAGYGRAYIYYRAPSGSFAYETNFIDAAGVNTDQFGYAVCCYIDRVSGEGWAFVGAPFAAGGGTARGKLLVYKRNGAANTWTLFQTLNGFTTNGQFGKSISYDASGARQFLAVGEPLYPNSSSDNGSVRVFDFDSTLNQWTLNATLVGQLNNNIGESISLTIPSSNEAYVVASNKTGATGSNTAAVWGVGQLFKHTGGSSWSNITKLFDVKGNPGYYFGNSISINPFKKVIVGSPGAPVNGVPGAGKVIIFDID